MRYMAKINTLAFYAPDITIKIHYGSRDLALKEPSKSFWIQPFLLSNGKERRTKEVKGV